MVVFVESRISGHKADRSIASLGFPYSHRIEFVHCCITDKHGGSSALATVVYGSPNATKCKAMWSNFYHLSSSINLPWVLFGDFNATIYVVDRASRSSSMKPCKLFQNFIYDFGLHDMGFNGPEYT
ncbi:hypothetical protein V6N13_123471 [Hibiscus sabdariffa]